MDQILVEGIRAARRIVVGVVGTTVLGFGLALLVLPGPAFVVIPIGLGILAIEFSWARRWLRRARGVYKAQPEDIGESEQAEEPEEIEELEKATGRAAQTPPSDPNRSDSSLS
jgi:hypothetical protein